MTKSVSHGGHESIPEHISNTAKIAKDGQVTSKTCNE